MYLDLRGNLLWTQYCCPSPQEWILDIHKLLNALTFNNPTVFQFKVESPPLNLDKVGRDPTQLNISFNIIIFRKIY